MKSIKCKSCGLTNFSSDIECRRCKFSFVQPAAIKGKDKLPRSFSILRLVMLAVALGAGYYFYSAYFGSQGAGDKTITDETRRPGSQPTPGLSRSENDRQRSGHYGDAVRNSSSLKAHEQRTKESEKAMQQISNSR